MIVKAKKVKNGYLIPPTPALDRQGKNEVILDIKLKSVPRKKIEEKSYNELRDEAIGDRYLKKEKRKVPSRLSDDELEIFSKKYGLDDINSFADIIKKIKRK